MPAEESSGNSSREAIHCSLELLHSSNDLQIREMQETMPREMCLELRSDTVLFFEC